MASTTGREERPVHARKAASWLLKVFDLNPAAINWPRGVMVLDVLLVALVVSWAIVHEEYLFSAIFGVVFTALADPRGSYQHRATHTGMWTSLSRRISLGLSPLPSRTTVCVPLWASPERALPATSS